MKKYILHPGHIDSKFDSDTHFISGQMLMRLYKLNPENCIILNYENPTNIEGYDSNQFIHLYPKYDGNYKLPG